MDFKFKIEVGRQNFLHAEPFKQRPFCFFCGGGGGGDDGKTELGRGEGSRVFRTRD